MFTIPKEIKDQEFVEFVIKFKGEFTELKLNQNIELPEFAILSNCDIERVIIDTRLFELENSDFSSKKFIIDYFSNKNSKKDKNTFRYNLLNELTTAIKLAENPIFTKKIKKSRNFNKFNSKSNKKDKRKIEKHIQTKACCNLI